MKQALLLAIISLLTFPVWAQDTLTTPSEKLIIGITTAPPFVMQKNGNYEGLSISSWNLVNEKLGADFKFKPYPDLNSLLQAVERKEIDLSINPITVTDIRMNRMDFSQPYFISHTAVARRSGSMMWTYLSNLLSWNFISAILILVGVIFIFGFLVWLFERRSNTEEFGQGPKGILQGFWWSAVTMTTVGYGDKSPRTFGGRFIGLIWMFLAIIMISSLTAGIASSLTVQNIHDEINSIKDLDRFEVASVESSSAHELLEQYNIDSKNVVNAEEGLNLLLKEETNLFVYDQPIIAHIIEQKGLQDDLEILSNPLKKDYYSYTFPKGSKLLKKIDPILMSTLKSIEWNTLIEDY